jgi:uncharacterized ferritin-like protein (DUF455 family)
MSGVDLAAQSASEPPQAGTLEAWAWDYLLTRDVPHKFQLPAPPGELEPSAPARREVRPFRPHELSPAREKAKTPGPEALRAPARRARLVHTFLHHELQAAELMCWAILAYPRPPAKFRMGLAKIARDEVRHMGMYAEHLADLGHAFGDFPVRDWFWDRVPAAPTEAHFVATMGIGFEGGNLDHALRFARRFRNVGDVRGAKLQETIFEEEIGHVRFAFGWFRRFTGQSDFGSWVHYLPPPLSPMVMRGDPLEREGRARAGFSPRFVDELEQWRCNESGF